MILRVEHSVKFCRAATGGVLAICTSYANRLQPRLRTPGFDNKEADQPRWLP